MANEEPIAHQIVVERCNSVGFSLTGEPIQFDLNDNFDVLCVWVNNRCMRITDENRMFVLPVKLFGTQTSLGDSETLEVIYYSKQQNRQVKESVNAPISVVDLTAVARTRMYV